MNCPSRCQGSSYGHSKTLGPTIDTIPGGGSGCVAAAAAVVSYAAAGAVHVGAAVDPIVNGRDNVVFVDVHDVVTRCFADVVPGHVVAMSRHADAMDHHVVVMKRHVVAMDHHVVVVAVVAMKYLAGGSARWRTPLSLL